MHASIAIALRTQFAKALRELLPNFQEDRNVELPAGWRAYRWQSGAGFSFFVVLCISTKSDRFTVELAWSHDGSLPSPSILNSVDANKTGKSIRMSTLWHPQQIDYWWPIGKERTLEEMAMFVPDQSAKEKLKDVAPKVADAIGRLRSAGIPHFQKIASECGISSPVADIQGHTEQKLRP